MKLPKTYDANQYEKDIYKLWEEKGAFIPKNRGDDGYYSIVMPPPNANANLHIGFELTAVLEDIPVRYHRMKGKAALLLPGADHAGFETQVVYEKQLAKEGKSRFDFSRSELYKQIWEFVAQNRSNFETQFRRMGASCDWTRFTFTLDERIVKRAYATFKKMWDEGLVYRGQRLVNFCTFHGTGFADIEVAYKTEQSKLWHINYPLTDESGSIAVATTRPETMLGDTAVAVHPSDKRYAKYIGKTVRLPLTNRDIPIIADEMVELEFGTGAVKITPAHDPNDYEVAQRHDLPMITVIDFEGKIGHESIPDKYRGLAVEDARKAVVNDLKEQGFLEKEEEYEHSVGHCYKCGTVIQPLLKEQWFVDMKPLASEAIKALNRNKITFYPAAKKDQLVNYLEGLRDWNISRQIAWGIPIPAFQNLENPDDWIYDERVDEEEITVDGKTYRRDPDVFDTWFSSSSWPYATLNFPDGEDFKKFYPLSLMETGGEILYPWVSRMIMLGLYVTGDVPFREVYIHGYVMAEDGSKMSKSIGNVVDPLPVIETYGSDALRMGIIAGRSAGVNRGYDPRKVEEARNFCNKLWNIARYVEGVLDDDFDGSRSPEAKSLADHWVLSKLQHGAHTIGSMLDSYRYAEAYETLYHLVWDDVADWYIEASKSGQNKPLLAFTLETILKLAHPFAPFVTEAIWQTLGWEKDSLIMLEPWPELEHAGKKAANDFELLKDIVQEVRQISNSLQLQKPRLLFAESPLLSENSALLMRLAKLSAVEQTAQGQGLRLVQAPVTAWLDIDQETIARYRDKLKQTLSEQEASVARLQQRLANEGYVKSAPEAIVQQTREQLHAARTGLMKVKTELESFEKATKGA